MKRTRMQTVAVSAVAALSLLTAPASIAAAASDLPAPMPLPPGRVVALKNTPNIWIADSEGKLHYAVDLTALQSQFVDWTVRADVELEQLLAQEIGAPWLSSGALIKTGPEIYIPERDEKTGRIVLSHVQSLQDLALIGVNASNYGMLVLDEPTWEQMHGMDDATVPHDKLTLTFSQMGVLDHAPELGSDLMVTMPERRGWVDVSKNASLDRLQPPALLAGQKILGTWRVLDNPGGAYVYFQIRAVPLAAHPEIERNEDLAAAALTKLCGTAGGCTYSAMLPALVDGIGSVARNFKITEQFESPTSLGGIASEKDGQPPTTAVDWYGQDLFFIRGNYRYQLRLTAADPAALSSRIIDLDKALATVDFGE